MILLYIKQEEPKALWRLNKINSSLSFHELKFASSNVFIVCSKCFTHPSVWVWPDHPTPHMDKVRKVSPIHFTPSPSSPASKIRAKACQSLLWRIRATSGAWMSHSSWYVRVFNVTSFFPQKEMEQRQPETKRRDPFFLAIFSLIFHILYPSSPYCLPRESLFVQTGS